MRLLFILLVFSLGCSQEPAPYSDMTDNYSLPPEMKGCKVYVLGGGYASTYPLWVVISSKGEIMTVR